MKHLSRNKLIKWRTDNYASNIIAKSGSKERELQELATEIFDIMFKHNVKFDISSFLRKSNELPDTFSKTIDYDDWYVTPDLFKMLTRRGGVATIDSENYEIQFKNASPATLGVDACAFD